VDGKVGSIAYTPMQTSPQGSEEATKCTYTVTLNRHFK